MSLTTDLNFAASDDDRGHRLSGSENYSVEDVTGFAELLPELETSEMLTDTVSRRNAALVYSCLFGPLHHCIVLIDPDQQAEPCIRFILEHASMSSHTAGSS